MGDETFAVEVRFFLRAESKDAAGFEAVRVMISAIAAGVKIDPMFAVSVQSESEATGKAPEGDSPKAEDVFGRIMSAPDVQ